VHQGRKVILEIIHLTVRIKWCKEMAKQGAPIPFDAGKQPVKESE
jgi:hypothetical protein